METNRKALMKHFSSILRKRCNAETEIKESIDPAILKFFKRKELIDIIAHKHGDTKFISLKLAELENEELLPLIGDDLFIISYVTQKWCTESQQKEELKVAKPIETTSKSDTISKKPKKK